MKLVDMAKSSINLIKKVGADGVNNIELAHKLQIPRRRVYDILAILKASNIIETKRERNGTHIYWKNAINKSKIFQDISKVDNNGDSKFLDQIKCKDLEQENIELRKKIDELSKNKLGYEQSVSSTRFPTNRIIIRSQFPTEKIKKVQSSKYHVYVEVESPGLIVDPVKE